MKKDLIDTIMDKEFNELSVLEKVELKEFCTTEEEYNQMKDVFVGVEAMNLETPKPKKETKESLDNLFADTYPKAAPIWYSSFGATIMPKDKPVYRQPLMQIAAVALLLVMIYPFWSSDVVQNPQQPTVAKVEDKIEDQSPEPKVQVAEVIPATQPEETIEEQPVTTRSISSTVLTPVAEPTIVASVAATGMTEPHPDGVYVALSQPASEDPELLDLLTTTF